MMGIFLGYLIQADSDDDLINELLDMIGEDLTQVEEDKVFAGQLEVRSLMMSNLIDQVYQKTNSISKVVHQMNKFIQKYYNVDNLVYEFRNQIVIGLPIDQGDNIYDLRHKNQIVKTILDEIFTTQVAPVVIEV